MLTPPRGRGHLAGASAQGPASAGVRSLSCDLGRGERWTLGRPCPSSPRGLLAATPCIPRGSVSSSPLCPGSADTVQGGCGPCWGAGLETLQAASPCGERVSGNWVHAASLSSPEPPRASLGDSMLRGEVGVEVQQRGVQGPPPSEHGPLPS